MSRDRRRASPRLQREGRGALIPFLEACDPDRGTSMAILRGMPGAGADLIEIGMPFTDPMADGPTIQAAGQRALKAGATLRRHAGDGARLPRRRRRDAGHPDGLSQPDPRYGAERFCADAGAAGVDGLIVVDLPREEADLLAGARGEATGSTSSAWSRRPPTRRGCRWC